MTPPRFILVISAESNLLSASLVTRESKSVASARQTFQLAQSETGLQEFDPAEVWYKLKKVIAACLDIGRTLSREIAGVAIWGETNARVLWRQESDEVVSSGTIEPMTPDTLPKTSAVTPGRDLTFAGTLADWIVWNLTGVPASGASHEFGKTRVRSPFDAELPVVTVLNVSGRNDPFSDSGQKPKANDRMLEAAARAWQSIDRMASQKFAGLDNPA